MKSLLIISHVKYILNYNYKYTQKYDSTSNNLIFWKNVYTITFYVEFYFIYILLQKKIFAKIY